MDILDILKFSTPTKVDWASTREAIVRVIIRDNLSFDIGSHSALVEKILKEARRFVRKYSPGTVYRLQSERKDGKD